MRAVISPQELHRADLVEVQQRFGSNDTRRALLRHLDNFLELVRSVGAQKLILDGSFVTAKENPADIDVILVLPDTFDNNDPRGSYFIGITNSIQHPFFSCARREMMNSSNTGQRSLGMTETEFQKDLWRSYYD